MRALTCMPLLFAARSAQGDLSELLCCDERLRPPNSCISYLQPHIECPMAFLDSLYTFCVPLAIGALRAAAAGGASRRRDLLGVPTRQDCRAFVCWRLLAGVLAGRWGQSRGVVSEPPLTLFRHSNPTSGFFFDTKWRGRTS